MTAPQKITGTGFPAGVTRKLAQALGVPVIHVTSHPGTDPELDTSEYDQYIKYIEGAGAAACGGGKP